MKVTRPSIVPDLMGNYGPEIYFDPQKSDEWPDGVWMCGIPGGDQYCGESPNAALDEWEQANKATGISAV